MPQREKGERNGAGKGDVSAMRRRWIRLVRVAAVLSLVLFLLPHAIRLGTQRWLADHGAVESRIKNVDFNPFTGRLALFGIAVRGDETDRLTCERFEVNLGWLPLLKKRLHLARLEVKGLDFDARRLDERQWFLGGIGLPRAENKESDWNWGIGQVHLREVAIDLHAANIDERFAVDHLRVANLYSWDDADTTPFRLKMSAFGGELAFEGQGRPFTTPMSVDATLEIEDMALKALRPYVETPIDGDLSLDAEVQVKKGGEADPLQVETDGEVIVADFLISVDGLRLSGKTLDWSGAFRFTGSEEKQWAVEGDLEAEAVNLDDPAEGLSMLRAAGLSLEGGHVEPGDVTIASVQLSGVEAFERPGDAPGQSTGKGEIDPLEQSGHLLKARQLELGPMRFNDEVLRFEEGVFRGAEILLVRRPEEGMELSVWLDDEAEKPTGDDSGAGGDGAGPHLRIDELRLDEARLLFVDRAISPPVRLDVRPLQLRIENLDMAAPDENISVVLDSKIDEYAALHLEGTVRPFGEQLDMAVKGKIDSFNLPSLSPYAGRHLDYSVKQGHLDVSFDWHVKSWRLDAGNDLKINKLKVESLAEGNKLSALLGLRASTALALMRDRQGNIEIALPIKGDLRDPEFEFDRVILQVVRKKVQEATVSYYATLGLSLLTGVPFPPGSVTLAGRVIDWLTSVRFDPVPFAPGTDVLDESGRKYLHKLVTALKEKENLRVVLCGRAGAVDLDGEKPPEKPWSEETRQKLRDLAGKRSLAVKDALVAAGIAVDRLFLCQPQLGEGEQAGPRVDIYL